MCNKLRPINNQSARTSRSTRARCTHWLVVWTSRSRHASNFWLVARISSTVLFTSISCYTYCESLDGSLRHFLSFFRLPGEAFVQFSAQVHKCKNTSTSFIIYIYYITYVPYSIVIYAHCLFQLFLLSPIISSYFGCCDIHDNTTKCWTICMNW